MKNLIIGLVGTMVANILLGATLSKFKKEFSWKNLLAGLFKASCIVIGCILMYVCSYYNPDIMVANINGMNVNLITGMKALFVAGIIMYGMQDLNKLKNLLKVSTLIESKKEESTIKIPVENEIKGEE